MGVRIKALVLIVACLGLGYILYRSGDHPRIALRISRDAEEPVPVRVAPFGPVATPRGDSPLISESFESWLPWGWDTVVTDTSSSSGWYPSAWHQSQVLRFSGEHSAAVWWSYNRQSEWLLTPEFELEGSPIDRYMLEFWSFGYQGSGHRDHYCVLVSTDGGSTWPDTLLDLSELTEGWNQWYRPHVLSLDAYGGMRIRLAFHAFGPEGLWYAWAIDDVRVLADGLPDEHSLLFSFDFSEDDCGFVHLNPPLDSRSCDIGTNEWEWGAPSLESGPEVGDPTCEGVPLSSCFGTALDAEYSIYSSSSRLVSPLFHLPGDYGSQSCRRIFLEVCHWYDIEEETDGGNVVLFDGDGYDGDPSNVLFPVGGTLYDALVSPNCQLNACLVDNEAAFTGTRTTWTKSYFDLSPYMGQEIRVAFDFGSEPLLSRAGWYIGWVKIWCILGTTEATEFFSFEDIHGFRLDPPSPSIFSESTEIGFVLPSHAHATMQIVDRSGRVVRELLNEPFSPGDHRLRWDGRDDSGTRLPSGIYLVRLKSEQSEAIQKMVLIP
jgi:hypothetical protein